MSLRCRGLSPRVRGNHRISTGKEGITGPIPACAGQPALPACIGEHFRAYPRVCGATRRVRPQFRACPGLSPRVRGNPMYSAGGAQLRGPIPACAGQPGRLGRGCWCRRAYPRVCGATNSTASSTVYSPGLSPRVRGNLFIARSHLESKGPIPACAGQPACAIRARRARRAYPRVCGATSSIAKRAACALGLSPRVRGNPRKSTARSTRERPIPACAGQPESQASA